MPIENEGPSEDDLFDNAVDGAESAPPAEPIVEQPPPEVEAVEASPQVEAEEPADEDVDDGSPVPSWRFRKAQETKRAAQAERDVLRQERDRLVQEQQEFRRWMMTQQQKPVEQPKEPDEPDPLLDPRGYRDALERRFEERLLTERRESSLQTARKVYKEEFDEAYQAAQRHVDPALGARMRQSSDPGETLIGWFRELKVRAEVGNDPAAYRKKVRDEFLKDPEFRKAAMEAWRSEVPTQSSGRPNVRLAPSLNGVSRAGSVVRASQEDFSDDALWDATTT